jgi:hypothetical protein
MERPASTLPVLGTLADAAWFVAAHPVVFVGVVPAAVWLLIATVVAPDEGLLPDLWRAARHDGAFDWGTAVPSTLLGWLTEVLTTAIVASVAAGMRSWSDVRERFMRSVTAALLFDALLAAPDWVSHALDAIAAWATPSPAVRGVTHFVTGLVAAAWVYPMVRWSVVIPAIVVDGIDLSTALRHSWTLSRHRFWSVVALPVIPMLVMAVTYLAPNPVLPIVFCFGGAFIHTALVLAYRHLSGAEPIERSASGRATMPAPA